MDNETAIREVIFLDETLDLRYAKEITQLCRLTYGILFPVVIAFGLLGNIANLMVLTRPLLQSTPYMFPRSRAVSDLLAMLSCAPFIIQMTNSFNTWDNYWTAFYYAKLEMFVMNSLLGVSALYITAFSLERYLYIHKPLKMHFDSNNRKKTLIAVIVIPLLTPFLHIPYCFSKDIHYGYNRVTNSSQYSFHDNEKTVNAPVFVFYILILQSLFRIGPTVAVIVLNMNIFFEYRKILKRRLQLRKSDSVMHQRNEEKRLMLLLAGTSLTFLICTSPAAILSIAFKQNLKYNYGFQLFRAIANLLEICNCALPIIIYLTVSTDFRKTAASFFCKREHIVPNTIS